MMTIREFQGAEILNSDLQTREMVGKEGGVQSEHRPAHHREGEEGRGGERRGRLNS